MRQKRKKIWIDRFQTTLSCRLALYFLLYQATVWALFWIDGRLSALTDMTGGVAAGYVFVLTPIVTIGLGLLFIYDSIKETHRIVGPMYRFRKTIQAVTAGEDISIIKLRDGDYLQDMRDDLNAMLRALEDRGAIKITGSREGQLVTV